MCYFVYTDTHSLCFKIEFCYVVQAVLDLMILPCQPPRAGISAVSHHAWIVVALFKTVSHYDAYGGLKVTSTSVPLASVS